MYLVITIEIGVDGKWRWELLDYDAADWYCEHGTGYDKITDAARDAERAMRTWEEEPHMFDNVTPAD